MSYKGSTPLEILCEKETAKLTLAFLDKVKLWVLPKLKHPDDQLYLRDLFSGHPYLIIEEKPKKSFKSQKRNLQKYWQAVNRDKGLPPGYDKNRIYRIKKRVDKKIALFLIENHQEFEEFLRSL